MNEPSPATVAETLVRALRGLATAFAPGDEVAPCAVLWPDGGRLWEPVINELQAMMPELFVMGQFDPSARRGPALWLRCVEARTEDVGLPTGVVPVFYLPGMGRDELREMQDLPLPLSVLGDLQHRGITWLQPGGRDWTPARFLAASSPGPGLNIQTDQATHEALAGALGVLIKVPLDQLRGKYLDSSFLNNMLAPDTAGLVLRWLDDQDRFKQGKTQAELRAFSSRCKNELGFAPSKDSQLKVAKLLARRQGAWQAVWKRFIESPMNYRGVVEWLNKATPRNPDMFDTAEIWPGMNYREEVNLAESLASLVDKPKDKVILKVRELEGIHGVRRGYAWARLEQSPFAMVLEPLSRLADLCQMLPGAPDATTFATNYTAGGWNADAAVIETLAMCRCSKTQAVVPGVVRAIYFPWVDGSARHLQELVRRDGEAMKRRRDTSGEATGRLIVFADGLRMDVAHRLVEALGREGMESRLDWDWSTVPSVTATAKPAVSPISGKFRGSSAEDEFAPRLLATDQLLTHDRFVHLLEQSGWQYLKNNETGDPQGNAWTEAGKLDKRGHEDGWKLAFHVETEVRELAGRIVTLARAGWREITVVTDHGWLLVPGGMAKVELPSYLSEHKWGRCASLKESAQTSVQLSKWFWNEQVGIVCPPGAGCYLANREYGHGGISLQEMVVPVIEVLGSGQSRGNASINSYRWTSATCTVTVSGGSVEMKVDIRRRQDDPGTSVLADQAAKALNTEGRAKVYLEEDGESGFVVIVLLDQRGQVIDSLETTIGSQP